jgi:hypothetical protein
MPPQDKTPSQVDPQSEPDAVVGLDVQAGKPEIEGAGTQARGTNGQTDKTSNSGAEQEEPADATSSSKDSSQEDTDRDDEQDRDDKKKEEEKKREEEEKKKKEEEEKNEQEKNPEETEENPAKTEAPEGEAGEPAADAAADDALADTAAADAVPEVAADAVATDAAATEVVAADAAATAEVVAADAALTTEAAAAGAGLAVGWWVVLIIVGIIIIIFIIIWIVSMFGPRTSVSPTDADVKPIITDIETLNSAGKLKFYQFNDLDKIKQGQIGMPSIQMIDYLGKLHDQILINYNGQESGSVIGADGQRLKDGNEPFEFDISSVDEIKCTDLSSNTKSVDLPIYLASSYNWKQNAGGGNIRCGVGYYPGLETAVTSPYSSIGPGEFSLGDIGTNGPKAAKQKMAEVLAEVLDINTALPAKDGAKNDNLPVKITLDSTTGSDVLTALQSKIAYAYPPSSTTDPQTTGVKLVDNLPFGFHLSFL